MTKGKLALVLHAHLPYVRSAKPGSLEEDWFFQALLECYLPLLDILEKARKAKGQHPKLTISLSPTLLSMLDDEELKKRFPQWISVRLNILKEVNIRQKVAADYLHQNIQKQLESWRLYEGNLISRFANLKNHGIIDILTCAATHGYLPLLRENPETIIGQFKTAIREHIRLFEESPLGIWLPECAYYEGLDHLMIQSGLRYAVLDGHGLLNAKPRPRYGLYAPICSKNGVAFFGRDGNSTLPVWSAKQGYPGDPEYREFHRDLGWDLSIEKLQKIGIQESRPLGLKLNKVTSQTTPLDKKDIYNQNLALKKVKEHAKDYLRGRKKQIDKIVLEMKASPMLVAPFDAELFGHWWFEGPYFLSELFKQAKKEEIEFTTLKDFLISQQKIQLCEPCPSSWGQGGFHHYWLNETNAWVVNEWSKAGSVMVEKCSIKSSKESNIRILHQAAKELLLSQSSDWSFILKAGTTTELALNRINLHLKRFWNLIKALEANPSMSESELRKIEMEDCLFPLINPSDWKKLN